MTNTMRMIARGMDRQIISYISNSFTNKANTGHKTIITEINRRNQYNHNYIQGNRHGNQTLTGAPASVGTQFVPSITRTEITALRIRTLAVQADTRLFALIDIWNKPK